MKSILAIIIVAVIIFLLMIFLGCFTPEEKEIQKDWGFVDSQIQSTKKLHEEETWARAVFWDGCCVEKIRVEFEYM